MAEQHLYDLLRIGLTEGESKVYLALLELGSSTVGPIVKKARVAYSNVYDILNRLIEKGIVSYIIKNKTKYFQAAGPSNLYDYLDKKEKEINEQKLALKELLPRLLKLQENIPEQEAEIFIGKKGLKAAYEKFFGNITVKDYYLFFYIHRKEYGEEADRFYWNLLNEIFAGKRMLARGISNDFLRTSWLVKRMKKKISIIYVNFPIPGNIDVYQDKVILISWIPSPIAFLIKSRSIADDFRAYFNAVWKTAKP